MPRSKEDGWSGGLFGNRAMIRQKQDGWTVLSVGGELMAVKWEQDSALYTSRRDRVPGLGTYVSRVTILMSPITYTGPSGIHWATRIIAPLKTYQTSHSRMLHMHSQHFLFCSNRICLRQDF